MSDRAGRPTLKVYRPRLKNALTLAVFFLAALALGAALWLLMRELDREGLELRARIVRAAAFVLSIVAETFCVGFAADALRNLLGPPTVTVTDDTVTAAGETLALNDITSLTVKDGLWINQRIHLTPDMLSIPPETVKYAIEQRKDERHDPI